ncbi:uncharacterized protein [Panulirus ornatus]
MWCVDASRPYSAVCPPVGESGHDITHPCDTDTDCPYNTFCCRVAQGSTCVTRYEPTSPNCPPPVPNLNCFRTLHNCNSNQDCKSNGPQSLCCLQPGCGRYCTREGNGYNG